MGYNTWINGFIELNQPISDAVIIKIKEVNWWCEEVKPEEQKLVWDGVDMKRVECVSDTEKMIDILQESGYKIVNCNIEWSGEESEDKGEIKFNVKSGKLEIYMLQLMLVDEIEL